MEHGVEPEILQQDGQNQSEWNEPYRRTKEVQGGTWCRQYTKKEEQNSHSKEDGWMTHKNNTERKSCQIALGDEM